MVSPLEFGSGDPGREEKGPRSQEKFQNHKPHKLIRS